VPIKVRKFKLNNLLGLKPFPDWLNQEIRVIHGFTFSCTYFLPHGRKGLVRRAFGSHSLMEGFTDNRDQICFDFCNQNEHEMNKTLYNIDQMIDDEHISQVLPNWKWCNLWIARLSGYHSAHMFYRILDAFLEFELNFLYHTTMNKVMDAMENEELGPEYVEIMIWLEDLASERQDMRDAIALRTQMKEKTTLQKVFQRYCAVWAWLIRTF